MLPTNHFFLHEDIYWEYDRALEFSTTYSNSEQIVTNQNTPVRYTHSDFTQTILSNNSAMTGIP